MSTYWASSSDVGDIRSWPPRSLRRQANATTWICRLGLLALASVSMPAVAQITAQDNYDPYIRDRSAITTIDQDIAFGDKTDVNSGETNFYVTVASLPGNNQLEVALRYKYVRNRAFPTSWHWERDDPYLSGDFIQTEGWVLGNSLMPSTLRSTARCTGTNLATGAFMPPAVNVSSDGKPGYWYPYEYYNGIHLVLPRGGGAVMIPESVPALTPPSQGGPYAWVTNDGWFFS